MVKKEISSPLRFPGSKSRVYNKMSKYLNIPHCEYREPFVGGGSIFFKKPLAQSSWINDKDELIYSFFIILRDNPEGICKRIRDIGLPTVELWKKLRKEIPQTTLDKAFSLLFFNRTNYSGIYKANPIGGMGQKSKYTIDCRWNTELLCEKIMDCSRKLKGVKITCHDYEELLLSPGKDVLIFLDPPYYEKGSQLYPVSMTHEEHVKLASLLKETNHKFLLTIDDCPMTREIYNHRDFYRYSESWSYTINFSKIHKEGREMFISNFYYEEEKDIIDFDISISV
jgi:DNA adenine methylase